MLEYRTCRICKKTDSKLVHYNVRHYAHGRCWLWRFVPLIHRDLNGVKMALDTLPIGALVNFQLGDFDKKPNDKTMSAIGMTMKQFIAYYEQRQKLNEKLHVLQPGIVDGEYATPAAPHSTRFPTPPRYDHANEPGAYGVCRRCGQEHERE